MTDRAPDALRTLTLEPGWAPQAEGSCLIAMGDTRVLCTASVDDSLPPWREASGKGWVTAEYGMLPRSTHSRRARERKGAGGRTREIERLIGRSLRSVIDFEALGPRMIVVDCDVLQADGGTRTASITGGFLALAMACLRLRAQGVLDASPLKEAVAAISVGIVDGEPRLDLDYALDSAAQVDMNVVATESGRLVEVQGTAEGEPFTREEHDRLLDLAFHGIEQCLAVQRQLVDFLEARH
ncbi:MAG: ribonuclease PH [Gemmatimonadetes bacterium]|nr:ribonuclease PH [Gemmatimonadota bacterium]MBT8403097.1 ribonuclease PH [Gemmatimonadota bacterium]NNK63605.1 ribonuclease PH [Gemmatimonadota bacterium]